MTVNSPNKLRKWIEFWLPVHPTAEQLYAAAEAWDIETARCDGWKALALDYAKQIANLRKRLEATRKYLYQIGHDDAWLALAGED